MGASAMDAGGNVFVTGSFTGVISLGTITLASHGGTDLFVAKYVPATNTWAWAQTGGGRDYDYGYGIAVSGGNVYVTGAISNDLSDLYGVRFGAPGAGSNTMRVNGASSNSSADLVVAKYTDQGTSARLDWTQVGGGTGYDHGFGIAVSGSNVYVTGWLTNNTTNRLQVLFGATGTTSGTVTVNGASPNFTADLLVVKYTDNGTSATLTWTQVGGGTGFDLGRAIAVSGNSVYVTGVFENNTSNLTGVLFGGTATAPGTVQVNGASSVFSSDVVVAKYTDNGAMATLNWTQVGGGTGNDQGRDLAVGPGGVYITGQIVNNSTNAAGVLFGGSGTTPGTVRVNGASASSSPDLLVAKYIDNGPGASLVWTQVGGGTAGDAGTGIAVSGNNVYVIGDISNSTADATGVVFGSNGTTPGTVPVNGATTTTSLDVVVAKYTDNGAQAALNWTKVGGGSAYDASSSICIHGNTLCVTGEVTPAVQFPPFVIAGPRGNYTGLLGLLRDPTLATASGQATSKLQIYPNPAHAAATLTGLLAGATVWVCDTLGRVVAQATARADGTARLTLPAGLATGVYVVRSGFQTQRLVVE